MGRVEGAVGGGDAYVAVRGFWLGGRGKGVKKRGGGEIVGLLQSHIKSSFSTLHFPFALFF